MSARRTICRGIGTDQWERPTDCPGWTVKDQLSLAIGREGQNARLAARLTGWRIDIRSETEFAAEEVEHGYEEEEAQGRCAAILTNGRRCPNAALPSSRYCGIDAHQALAGTGTDQVGADAPANGAPSAQAADSPGQ